jgi:D-alanyl-D-alanine carboxypeptidase
MSLQIFMNHSGLLGRTAASALLAIAITLGFSDNAKAFSMKNANSHSPLTNAVSDELAPQLQAALDQSLGDIPGASVAIVSPKGTWFGVSGLANLETGTAVVPEDRFQIGSITKTFVATTVLQLAEEGKLSLDDTLDDWLPSAVTDSIPNHERITIRQLLSHTSGVADYLDALFLQAQTNPAVFLRDWQPEELIALTEGQTPDFEPGESWQYSNTNYILLGAIVEAATNSNVASEIRSRIIEPLELDDTFFAQEEEIPGGFVNGYWDFDGDGELNDVTGANMSWAWTTGAMVSNPQDLVSFIKALLVDGKLLESDSLEQMLTFVKPIASDNYSAYGLGIGSLESPGRLWYGHRGLTLGHRANLFYSPIEDIIYVELINLSTDQNISNPIFTVWRAAQEPVASVPEPGVIPGLILFVGVLLTLNCFSNARYRS